MRAWRIILRCLLGAVLFGTALGKALDVSGFCDVIRTYDVLPEVLIWPSAVGMVLTEFGLSIWLLSNRALAKAALCCAALHLVFLNWASLALIRGLDIPNCGCFGVFYARPLTVWTLVEDGVLVGLSVALCFLAVRDRRGAS